MRKIWSCIKFERYIKTGFLSMAICLLLLLTGCGSAETLAEKPGSHSGEASKEAVTEANAEQSVSDKVQIGGKQTGQDQTAAGDKPDTDSAGETDAKNAFSNLEITGTKFEEAGKHDSRYLCQRGVSEGR